LDQETKLAGENGLVQPPARPGGGHRGISIGLLLAAIVVVTGIAWPTVREMLHIWWRLSAYNYCFFILPIAGYMAWERRERLAGLTFTPFWPGLVAVGGFAAVWLLAHGGSIMEGEQLAYVGIVQGLMLTILGRRIFRAQLLPITYLWLLAPTGSFLLPNLQAVASRLTAFLLHFTSIPFYNEGFYFQLPVGLFYIAPGCAGLNFLLAALALSIVYADLMYAGWRRKVICILIWLGVAVLANGVRIFAILALAQISDMQLAIVDDHLLYGWGFFFLILMGLMLAGQRFSNMPSRPAMRAHIDWMPAGTTQPGSLVAATLSSVLLAGVITGYGQLAFSSGVPVGGLSLMAPPAAGEWIAGVAPGYPDGSFSNADSRQIWRFDKGAGSATLFAAYYAAQWDGHEAVMDNENIFDGKPVKISRRAFPAPIVHGAPRKVAEEIVSTRHNDLRVWRWYCVGDHFTQREIEVRMRTALDRLFFRDSSVTVFTLYTQDSGAAREELTSLMQALSEARPGVSVTDAQGQTIRSLACW